MLNDTLVGVGRRRDGPWRSAVAGALVAAIVTFTWSMDVSPPGGPEGLMWLEIWGDLFMPALPRGMILGVAVVWLANKLVSWAPNYWPPWDPASPPPETIDGHFGPAWLIGFVTPLVVAPLFGYFPLVILVWSLRSKGVGAEVGDGAGIVTAIGASMLLVPRLARAAMREVDSRLYARHL
jgi:hypothetical protein